MRKRQRMFDAAEQKGHIVSIALCAGITKHGVRSGVLPDIGRLSRASAHAMIQISEKRNGLQPMDDA